MINQIVDLKKFVWRIWLSLWLILIILTVAKLVFNIWFPIVIENQNFIKLVNYFENNAVLKVIIMFVFYIINANIFYLTASVKKKYASLIEFICIQICIIVAFYIKINNNLIGSIVELIIVIVIPIISLLKRKPYSTLKCIAIPIIVYLIVNLWQLNIFFIRDINDIMTNIPFMISIALQLDCYIFNIITWIGVSYMGAFGIGFLWGKSVTELQALKEKELKKSNPDTKYIASIDKRIEKLSK